MDPATRKKLIAAIMTILGIAVAWLITTLWGCSVCWTPQRSEVKFLWPDRQIHVKLDVEPSTQPTPHPAQ